MHLLLGPLCLRWPLVNPCTYPICAVSPIPMHSPWIYKAPFAPQSVCDLLRVAYPAQPVQCILHVLLYPPCATPLTHPHWPMHRLSCILLDPHNPSHRPSTTHCTPLIHHSQPIGPLSHTPLCTLHILCLSCTLTDPPPQPCPSSHFLLNLAAATYLPRSIGLETSCQLACWLWLWDAGRKLSCLMTVGFS